MSVAFSLCAQAELPAEGQAKEFTVGDQVLCVAMIGGKPMAINNVCPHRGGPLAEGSIEGGKVVCPWHQWEFDLATGESNQSSDIKAEVYAVKMIDGNAVVEV